MALCAIILASALCFLSFLGTTYCHDNLFFIEGKVYCDICRTQFVTRVNKFIKGALAKVKLECRDREGRSLRFSNKAVTEKSRYYSVEVDGDHEEEICGVVLMESNNDIN